MGGPVLVFAGYKVSAQAVTPIDWFLVGACVLMGAGCILCEPCEIASRPQGLRERRFPGIKKKLVPWAGASARYISGQHEVLIIGEDGTAITHSQYHVGQQQLIHQLEEHRVFVQGMGDQVW